MSEEKVLESIKETCSGSAGCSLRIKVAAYNLLDSVNILMKNMIINLH